MKRENYTIWLILLGFFFREFSRNLLLPNLIVISDYYFGTGGLEAIEIGLIFTTQMGASAIACLFFGIMADRTSRKTMAMFALYLWVLGLLLVVFAFHYPILLVGELLIGFGSGGFIPVSQAILGDATPTERKGKIYGLSSILMMLGFLASIIIASVFTPNWQFPFVIVFISLFIVTLLYTLKGAQYQLGKHDEGLKTIYENDDEFVYDFRLNKDSFKQILRNKTNILIFIEGIFSIFGFSMLMTYFFPFLEEGPAHITPLTVSLIMLLITTPVNIAGIFTWGYLGDRFVKKYSRIRVLIIALTFTISTPFFIIAFWMPVPPVAETTTVWAALSNPGILIFILLISMGLFISSGYDSNQPPIMNAINLPETRGSVFAVNRFVEELGGALGPLVVGIFFEVFGQNYSFAMTLGMLFMGPGIFCWWLVLKTYPKDRSTVLKILEKRVYSIQN